MYLNLIIELYSGDKRKQKNKNYITNIAIVSNLLYIYDSHHGIKALDAIELN